jgi:hypothetical protein
MKEPKEPKVDIITPKGEVLEDIGKDSFSALQVSMKDQVSKLFQGSDNPLDAIRANLSDGFQLSDLEPLTKLLEDGARYLVRRVLDYIPGATGKEKLAWVKAQIIQAVESIDNLLPVVGLWADLPWIDAAEAMGISAAVDTLLTPVVEWAYAAEVINPEIPGSVLPLTT